MNDIFDASTGPLGEDLGTLDGLDVLWSNVVRDIGEISSARRAVASSLEGSRWPTDVVDDLLLAITELIVNAFAHGEAQSVDVAVGVTPDQSQLAAVLRHVDRWPSQLIDTPMMARPQEFSGRGRAVVAAIADGFETIRQSDNEVVHFVRFSS